MAIFERLRAPATPDSADAEEKPEGPSIKEIRADRQKSGFFANMLEQEGQEALAKKLFFGEGEFVTEDFELMEQYRGQFAEKLERSERVKEMITPELVEEMGALHPDLGNILKAAGSRDISRLVGNYLETLIFRDPAAFDYIYDGVENLNKKFEAQRVKDEELMEKLEAAGITEDEYAEILKKNQSHGMRVKEIHDLLEEREGRAGILEKIRDWRGNKRDARLLAAAKELGGEATKRDIDRLLKDVNEETANLGTVLTATLMGNTELNKSVGMILRGETPPKIEANVMGFAEAKQLMMSEEQVQERWEQEKQTPEYKKIKTPADKEKARDSFMGKLLAPSRRRTGWFARVSTGFMESLMEGMNFTL
ncbi:MAG: hypothetical protein AAB916_03000 [Patescibacteria group bacterium]